MDLLKLDIQLMKLKMSSFFVIFDRRFNKQRRNEKYLINFLRDDTKLQPLEELLYHQPNSEFLSVEGQ